MIKKQEPMKPRGIRFLDSLWNRIKEDAKKNKVTPSDVIRHIIESYYEGKK